jgi:hypothetical protein
MRRGTFINTDEVLQNDNPAKEGLCGLIDEG